MQHISVAIQAAVLDMADIYARGGEPVEHHFRPVWRQAADLLRHDETATLRYDGAKRLCESPIECLGLAALLAGIPDSIVAPTLADAEKAESSDPIIIPQLSFDRYRLDFGVLCGRRGQLEIFGLECDGREFHKDHARDNLRSLFLLGCGVRVFRARGSALYRDARTAVAPLVSQVHLHDWDIA